MAQLFRGHKERRVDAATCRFHLDVMRRPVQQEGSDIVPGAIALRGWNVDYPLGEVGAAIGREPRTFMLDNQALTLEADISVARFALEIVDADGCSAATTGAWWSHDGWIDLYELPRWGHLRCGHFLEEARNLR